MKKYHFLLTIMLLVMLGCERENFSDLEHQNSNTTIIPLEPIDVKNGMLVFMDEAHLTQVVSQCYKSIEMFSNIDPAVEGEIEENSNPMIQFENAYDYVSLRKAASFTTSNASADKYDDGSQAFFANHPVLGCVS
jgi:hypothetical protein